MMHALYGLDTMTTEQKYDYMLKMLDAYLSSESDNIAKLSNASAIIKAIVDRLNWAGFYLMKNGELVLGPFQGLPACNRIKLSAGVCGVAASTRQMQIVPDVHKFPGHIACDFASNSELVIPIIKNDTVYGVLDLDSPDLNRFTELEARYMEKFVEILNQYIDWNKIV